MTDISGIPDTPEFERLVRDALANLFDQAALATHPLATLVSRQAGAQQNRADQLRTVLVEAIEWLRPAGEDEPQPNSHGWRPYLLLHSRYVDGVSLQQIGRDLCVSQRQLRRDHSRAVQAVAMRLRDSLYPTEAGPEDESASGDENGADGSFPINAAPLDFMDLLHGVVATLQRRAESEGAQLKVVPPGRSRRVLADHARALPRQLHRLVVEEQLHRVEQMKKGQEWIDYAQLKPIIIGIIGGDGIGPFIAAEARSVLEFVLKEEVESGKVEMRDIEGLTIENRAAQNKSIPDDVLEEIKKCHVTLKGPTTTPRKGDPWPNIESCNVSMRRHLDLFANVRPVKVPKEGIDWVFFRENTEGAYIMGSKGVNITDDLAFDFTVTTTQGAERIIRLAFEFAKKNNINKVTIVTKVALVRSMMVK